MSLALRFGLTFEDLYRREGLARVDAAFIAHLRETAPELHDRLVTARRDVSESGSAAFGHDAESDLLVDLAPAVEDFIGALFGIGADIRALQAAHHELAPLYSV